jgi:hypothetical protein
MFHKHRRAFLRQNTAPRIQPVGPTAIVKDPAKRDSLIERMIVA